MIVLDASTVVSAVMGRASIPDRAVRRAFASDRVAVSEAVFSEIVDVFARPRLARFIDPDLAAEVLALLDRLGVFYTPTMTVQDCRDAKDNKYLELAVASAAHTIISSDADLLILNPWRGVLIQPPAAYLATTRKTDP